MEEYEDIEGDAFDAFDASDAPDATTPSGGQENEVTSQNRRMICQLDVGLEGKLVGNPGVLKATSGNVVKRLKMRQETRATTRAGKTTEAAVKQLATKKLQVEKAQMEGWKQMVMTEVVLELQGIKQAHEEAMGIQRQSFQLELKRIKEKLEIVEEEVRLLKSRKPTLEKELTQSIHANTSRQKSGNGKSLESSEHRSSPSAPAVGNAPMVSSSSRVTNGVRSTKPAPKSYAQVVASNVTQSTLDKSWTKVTSGNQK